MVIGLSPAPLLFSSMILILAQTAVVHVENPTQGMELLLFGVGFLCGALSFRMLIGRW